MIGKSQVFSTSSYVYLPSYTQIRGRGHNVPRAGINRVKIIFSAIIITIVFFIMTKLALHQDLPDMDGLGLANQSDPYVKVFSINNFGSAVQS